ncbi:MAG: hypothetical protein G01um101418_743 [Parcubacteria group bacterium Gr01-1014_18]|nr:MAG: hypothetical protein Greene041636_733 [Parcubacteria group bacterium Greene0416_36]TSC80235.1 MAG: hypothetical protein G01um101418_743 [Parcubacteria group bacterium Gr01-1014_18]TSC98417.1 MAG: hypothetical protein Greene101420_770 [Parcubacteria group bacterium Greene1014_20]TSD06958.1 MAG: hypothetical protein Greene07142_521 [Parcubacteria group bacterium Greene0714_2]
MSNAVDWKRLKSAFAQEARRKNSRADADHIVDCLRNFIGICGEFSVNRRMLLRIGYWVLEGSLRLLVPCCPDYGYSNGCYTFRGMGGGISLLAQCHIDFVEKVSKIFPQINPWFLVADLEAEDEAILLAVNKTKSEFLDLVSESAEAISKKVRAWGWKSSFMSECVPDLIRKESEKALEILNSCEFSQRIATDTHHRQHLYRKINSSFSVEQMLVRTRRTAAQYWVLGEYAHAHGFAICNHTTTNLSWYLKTEAAVLHNPISVY